ncbi:MAG: acetyl-CoA carboxylase biotin carboxylase subunit [Elusimicrobia bacterium]|nr:acetyl-CoA carboxylase biotin carboxylase subunit [Elusimicrobiota bacterium]
MKILIANRGEIAVRVIRACRQLGLKSVAVYSQADRESIHVALADEAVCIGPAPARESYLRIPAVLSAARVTKAEAIHPGYGFLSENADFAAACAERKILFIGPPADAIRKLGYKSTAKAVAREADVPIVPGTRNCVDAETLSQARAIGFPVMVKAAAGGGGKGMRLVRDPERLKHELEAASREAQAAFGDGAVYIEKFIDRPRHVEVQILADTHGNVAALPERDCTVQRRHQKLIEESPSSAITPKTRRAMQEAAVRLARAGRYVNAGTVEFLLDRGENFYFIEVNTRLQVEHPVTESVTGLDLVAEQIRIALGEKLSFDSKRFSQPNGHAIEFRINAEDPDRSFAPCPGTIEGLRLPGGPGVRVDTHLYADYTVPSYYDSLLAKLIISAQDRPTALARGRGALGELRIDGISTTASFHRKVLDHPDFISGTVDTSFVDRLLQEPPNAKDKNERQHSRTA